MGAKAYETETGEKQKTRELICQYAMSELNKVGHAFTLPSRQALCIKTFKRYFPKIQVTGVELDKAICKVVQDKGYICENSTVRQFAQEKLRPTKHFDIVFLDYFSYLSSNIFKDIDEFINNDNIMHKGKSTIFAITLSENQRCNENKRNETLALLANYKWESNRYGVSADLKDVTNGIVGFISDNSKVKECIELHCNDYKATDKSKMMYFILLKIVK
jgi:hypothetical protein